MVKREYAPDRGDLIWINFNLSLGHEQTGRRPAIVLSPKLYNKKSGLILVCPITSSIKGYPYEVEIGKNGVILTDQIKSVAWKERRAKFIASVPEEILFEVFDKIKTLLEI
jgi:mRNA interferase MazF